MTKGIRAFTNQVFNNLLPQRSELGDTGFRQAVIDQTIMAFGIKPTAAATHYNHALKMARAAAPEAVAGLGRPEGKKGGRKPKAEAAVDTVPAV